MTGADRALAITGGIIGGAVAVPTLAVLLARRDTRTARRTATLAAAATLTAEQLHTRIPPQRDRRAR